MCGCRYSLRRNVSVLTELNLLASSPDARWSEFFGRQRLAAGLGRRPARRNPAHVVAGELALDVGMAPRLAWCPPVGILGTGGRCFSRHRSDRRRCHTATAPATAVPRHHRARLAHRGRQLRRAPAHQQRLDPRPHPDRERPDLLRASAPPRQPAPLPRMRLPGPMTT